MSSPRHYEWQEFLQLVSVTCVGPRTYGFLVAFLPQEDVLERIQVLLNRQIVGISNCDLSQETYNLIAANTEPQFILE